MAEKNQEQLLEGVADLIVNSSRIVVFTGAGVSTESGIPDFRSPGGIWTKYDPDMFTYQKFISDPESRKMHWQLLGGEDFIGTDVQPNEAHYAVAELERMGKLEYVITQNIDDLHERAGNSAARVLHLHGTMGYAHCMKCGKPYSIDLLRRWIAEGVKDPQCEKCSSIIKPDVVFFGEALPMETLNEAQLACQTCELCIVIGSSLVVRPASLLPRAAAESGAKLIIINRDKTYLDHMASYTIYGSASQAMGDIIAKVREKV